jgi:hypothetical protein
MPEQPVDNTFMSKVTAPVDAKALPQSSVAPVSMEMPESAVMFPRKVESVPRVAELRTSQ